MIRTILALCSRDFGHDVMYSRLDQALVSFQVQGFSWDYLIHEAEKQGVAPLLYTHISSLDCKIPDSARRLLQSLYLRNRRSNTIRNKAVVEIISAYEVEKIDALLVKGIALCNFAYSEIGLRPMRDLDILVKSAVQSGNLTAGLQPQKADVFILAVPTPFKDGHQPDLSYVEAATRMIAPYIEAGNLVILESTSPVGTTEEVVAEILKDVGHDIDKDVFVLDSTTISVSIILMNWAKGKYSRGAVKMHTLLDLRGSIPIFVHITDGKYHDVNALDEIEIIHDAIYVMDKAYVDFKRLYDLNESKAFFVIRAKENFRFKAVKSRKVDKATGLRCDQTIRLSIYKSNKQYPQKLRRIKYYDQEKNLTLVFLTNNYDVDALDIASIYKNRWQLQYRYHQEDCGPLQWSCLRFGDYPGIEDKFWNAGPGALPGACLRNRIHNGLFRLFRPDRRETIGTSCNRLPTWQFT